MSGSLDRLAGEAARYDDETLTHLGNRGLLRRAEKLLAAQTPEHTIDDDSVVINGGGWLVAFADNGSVANGECSCATAGVCQHLIAAILYLQSLTSNESVARGPEIHGAIIGLDDASWSKLTNAAGRRWALSRAVSLDPAMIEVEIETAVLVRLPSPLAPVRFMNEDPSSGIVKPSGPNDDRIIALAVLCLRLHAGVAMPDLGSASPATELPKERAAVAARAVALGHDAVRFGISHLGDADQEHLNSFAASARGAKLYRLALVAERAADQIEAMKRRTASAEPATLLNLLSELHVLGEVVSAALEQNAPPSDQLLGRARSRFDNIGVLELIGAGHYPWGSGSFGGITGVFADVGNGRFFTINKPLSIAGRGQGAAIGWRGIGSVQSLANMRFQLSGASASDGLRLSTSPQTEGSVLGAADIGALTPCLWNGKPPPRQSRLLASPRGIWTAVQIDGHPPPVSYDEVAQRSVWPITAAGSEVIVSINYDRRSIGAIDRLEALSTEQPRIVIGRLETRDGRLQLFPVSVVFDDRLELLWSAGAPGHAVGEHQQDRQQPEIAQPDHLERFAIQLLAIAERGAARPTSEGLDDLLALAERWGLTPLTQALENAPDPATALLRGAWVIAEYQTLGSTQATA